MPTQQDINQFRRLIGDYEEGKNSDTEVTSWLDDAVDELTDDFATPLYTFDTLPWNYHAEVIYKAALNWWWNELSKLQTKQTISFGQAASNTGELWDRAFQMVQSMEAQWQSIRTMGFDVHVDNLSRFSKQTLRRIGGIREEDTHA